MVKMFSFVSILLTLLIESNIYNSIFGAHLSRNKRYVAFPDGSTWIMAFCMTSQTIIPYSIFTEGVNWGIAYELPNRTFSSNFINRNKFFTKRIYRRSLYNNIETLINSMGFEGRSCIFKSLCEISKVPKTKNSLAEKIVQILFKFPQQHLSEDEPEDHRLYHWAYRRGLKNHNNCATLYPACPFSLIDLALGNYNT